MARVKVCVLRSEATQSEAQVAACEREVARNRNGMMVTREFAELETEGVVGAVCRNRSKQASLSEGEDESATTRVSQASQRVVQREGGRVSVSGTRVARCKPEVGVCVWLEKRKACNGPWLDDAPRKATTAMQEVK